MFDNNKPLDGGLRTKVNAAAHRRDDRIVVSFEVPEKGDPMATLNVTTMKPGFEAAEQASKDAIWLMGELYSSVVGGLMGLVLTGKDALSFEDDGLAGAVKREEGLTEFRLTKGLISVEIVLNQQAVDELMTEPEVGEYMGEAASMLNQAKLLYVEAMAYSILGIEPGGEGS